MKKPIRLIRCIVHYSRINMTDASTENGCRAHVVIPSNTTLPSMEQAARKALSDQADVTGFINVGRVRIAKYSGTEVVA